MGKANINWVAMSNMAIIRHTGDFIKHTRLQQNITQEQLAENAGLNRWTVSQIENGESVTFSSLIQILRALNTLHVFDLFQISDEISPLEYAKLKKKQKERARNKNTKTQS